MQKLLVVLVACLCLFACASKPDKKSENPGDLYVEGVNLMKARKYDAAIRKFGEVRENFPFDPMALIATVKLGDAHFEKKDYDLAIGVYEDFFKAHPEDENTPYVLMRLGACYEKVALSVDRDQANTLKAIERYTYLKNRYPTSSYANMADQQLKALNQKLADRELYVGEFYFKSYQYSAAVTRLEYLLKKYPDAKGLDKALYYLAMSYRELDNTVKSDYFSDRLRTEYPKSVHTLSLSREKRTLQLQKLDAPSLKPEAAAKKEIELQSQAATASGQSPERPVASRSALSQANKAAAAAGPAPARTPRRQDIDLRPQVVKAVQEKPEDPRVVNSPQGIKEAKAEEEGQASNQNPSKSKESGGLGFINKSKPIDITSDTMEGFDKEKYVVFKGSVVAKQDDLYLFSDIIEARMNEETNEISTAHAKGNVKIIKQDRTATAREAFFDNAKGEIMLKGNVVVYQGQDKVTGNIITYYINEDRVVVAGEQSNRARAVLTPKKK